MKLEKEKGKGRPSSHEKSVEEEEKCRNYHHWMMNLKFNYFL